VIRRPVGALALSIVTALITVGCGKKGNPLPPLRPVPSRIADFAAHLADGRVELRFTVPVNGDGSTPNAVSRVEIYRVATPAGATAPSANDVLAGAKAPLAEIQVRPETDADRSAERPDEAPAAGEPATFVDPADAADPGGAAVWTYVAVGVAGRNRRGPLSAALHVPLTALPDPPADLLVSSTEQALRVSWSPSTEQAASVRILAVDRTGASPPTVLTPQPVTGGEFAMPVEFGRERCFSARTVKENAGVTLEGPLSPTRCATPIDTYAPAAPSGLQAIQEGSAITLNWTGVDAADLAGYVVLRGDGDGVTLVPLTRTPVTGTTYSDATVTPGATYTYSVYAVDNAPTANVSEQSNRYTVTVR
jgi:hypothetical protein